MCKLKKSMRVIVMSMFAAVVLLATFHTRAKLRESFFAVSALPSNESRLVVVRAVDDAGRPVSGAQVFADGVAVGLTDAFGEWRDVLHRESATDVEIYIVKNTKAQKFTMRRRVTL